EDVRRRVLAAVERIAGAHPNGDDVLVVAHGGVISVYACHLLACSFNSLWRLRVDNGSLTIVRPPRLVTLDDTGHLTPATTATTLMLIGFVSAGLMSFRQTLGVILGADIGTTLTVQLIAFRITDASPFLVGLGFTASFVARRRVMKDVGQAVLGLGLMFLGLKLILDNAGALK